MFIGHFAVALAAKKPAPKVSLGTLFIAAQFLDLIWPIFLLLGIETVKIVPSTTAFLRLDLHDYPLSHSLLTVIGWSVAIGGVHYAMKRYTRGALILGVAVFSHWQYPGSTSYVGLCTHEQQLQETRQVDMRSGRSSYCLLSCMSATHLVRRHRMRARLRMSLFRNGCSCRGCIGLTGIGGLLLRRRCGILSN